MKIRCISCGKLYRSTSIICKTCRNLDDSITKALIQKYNNAVEQKTIYDPNDFYVMLFLPQKNVDNGEDIGQKKLLVNGKEVRIRPPFEIKIDEEKTEINMNI